jgi:hypothetical protein
MFSLTPGGTVFLDGVFAVKADGAAGSPGPRTTGCFLSEDSASCAGLDIPEVSSKKSRIVSSGFSCATSESESSPAEGMLRSPGMFGNSWTGSSPGPSISRGHLLCMAATHSTMSSSDEIVSRPEDVGARAGLPFAVRLL